MPAHPEVPPQRSRETEDAVGVGPCSAGPHRYSQIVEIAVETSHPCSLLGAMHLRFGLLGDRQVIRAVPDTARSRLRAGSEPALGVLTHGLQKSVAGLAVLLIQNHE
jgi:hypothetical protein